MLMNVEMENIFLDEYKSINTYDIYDDVLKWKRSVIIQ